MNKKLDNNKQYLFIVGQNRSGTSLLRNILNKSKQVSLADENNYYGHIFRFLGLKAKIAKDLREKNYEALARKIYDEEVYRNFFYKNSAYWKWFKSHVSRNQFLADLKQNEFNEDELFQYFIEKFNEEGCTYSGDKTPDNFRYIDDLFRLPGQVRIIHLLRDPRAVYSSEVVRRNYKNTSKLSPFLRGIKRLGLIRIFFLLNVSIQYRLSRSASINNKKKYGKYYKVIWFEELVTKPSLTVKNICEYLNIEYQDEFLDQKLVSNYSGKRKQGIDKSTINKWKQNVSLFESKAIEIITGL